MAIHRLDNDNGANDTGGVGRIIPTRPGLCIVSADIGIGKTTLMCGIAATLTRAAQHVLYIFGEGSREDIAEQLQAAGADASRVELVDCVCDHPKVELPGMLENRAIECHLSSVDSLIVDPLVAFESDGIRKFRIRQHGPPVVRGVTCSILRSRQTVECRFRLAKRRERVTAFDEPAHEGRRQW